MLDAEEFAKYLDAMSMTYDDHWANYIGLIKERDQALLDKHVEGLKDALENITDRYWAFSRLSPSSAESAEARGELEIAICRAQPALANLKVH